MAQELQPTLTREEWLENAVDYFRDGVFKDNGYIAPSVRISTGFTGTSKRTKHVGVCYDESLDEENKAHIFINPVEDNSIEILNTVAHELIHATVGLNHGHKGEFKRLALLIGLEAPMTSTPSGPRFLVTANEFLSFFGEYPHKKLNIGESTLPPKQNSRNLKVECTNLECDYKIRISSKWLTELNYGAPECPLHKSILQ